MSVNWLNQLGLSADATGFAAMIYGASVVAEKVASGERAIDDIGKFLKTGISRSITATGLVQSVFIWTFTPNHFSWPCLKRSTIYTIIFSALGSAIILPLPKIVTLATSSNSEMSVSFLLLILPLTLCDYLSLAKTRYLITRIKTNSMKFRDCLFRVIIDILLSTMIFLLVWVLSFTVMEFVEISSRMTHERITVTQRADLVKAVQSIFEISFINAILTSVWFAMITISSWTLVVIRPIHRVSVWFFDVDAHPIQAIGFGAGALVIFGSLICAALRAIFS